MKSQYFRAFNILCCKEYTLYLNEYFFCFFRDLSFSKGDVVTILREIDDNWWEGVLNGKRGSIPKNFVEV